MSKKVIKKKGLIKGRSTAFLVSLAIHVALITVAGTFVVFNIIKKPPVKFEPVEKIDRPRMKLKKLQVKVKENTRPRDTTEQITTKTTLGASSVSLPPMRNIEVDLDTSITGFNLMADMAEMTLMGGKKSVGNDLIGTFYHFIKLRDGSTSDIGDVNPYKFRETMRDFLQSGWDTTVFSEYYRAPQKLFATQFFIPPCSSDVAPDNFGDKSTAQAAWWLCHYKGEIAYKDGGRFRFMGWADNYMFVRINGKVVLDATLEKNRDENYADWQQYEPNDSEQIPIGANGDTSSRWYAGNWFDIEPGQKLEMEVLFGEDIGGGFACMLAVQQEGVEYPERDRLPGPALPIFKTMPTPEHLLNEMQYLTPPGCVDPTNGPIFNVY